MVFSEILVMFDFMLMISQFKIDLKLFLVSATLKPGVEPAGMLLLKCFFLLQ